MWFKPKQKPFKSAAQVQEERDQAKIPERIALAVEKIAEELKKWGILQEQRR